MNDRLIKITGNLTEIVDELSKRAIKQEETIKKLVGFLEEYAEYNPYTDKIFSDERISRWKEIKDLL